MEQERSNRPPRGNEIRSAHSQIWKRALRLAGDPQSTPTVRATMSRLYAIDRKYKREAS
jgi:hypothetical protein